MIAIDRKRDTESPIEYWLSAYDRGHGDRHNRLIHQLFTPLFAASLLALLWCLPVPNSLNDKVPVLNWATLTLMAIIIYYFVMSASLAIGMLPFIALTVALINWLDTLQLSLVTYSSAGLLVAALGQHFGHRLETNGASLLRDLNYAAIAPVWVLAAIYRKLGLPY